MWSKPVKSWPAFQYTVFLLKFVNAHYSFQNMPVQVAPGIRLGTNCFYGRDGYSYHINKKRVSGGRASLRCSHYVALQCHGRASCTQRGKYFRQTQPHNHPSEPHTREVRLLRAAVLSRCREDGSTDLKEIYDQERRRLE